MVQSTVKSFGKPDILCNNAGIMAVEPRFLSDLSEEAWESTININLKGVFLCCKYTLPEMMNTGRGSIINISSIAAVKRSPNYAYAASKGGIVAFTQSLALQYGEYNIRANAVCPGSITTPAREKARRERPLTVELATRILKKEGTPEDIGHIAVYLASEESAYVTGSVFVIDGGSLGVNSYPPFRGGGQGGVSFCDLALWRKTMTYLITGGTGFIGAHVTRLLIEHGDKAIAFDVSPDQKLLDEVLVYQARPR